jgi:hypothetical protein
MVFCSSTIYHPAGPGQAVPFIFRLKKDKVILGRVMHMDKSTWNNNAETGEAGQVATWFGVGWILLTAFPHLLFLVPKTGQALEFAQNMFS